MGIEYGKITDEILSKYIASFDYYQEKACLTILRNLSCRNVDY